jgi:hypothetical protein
MDDDTHKTWRTLRRELPLNERDVATYRRLMDAEARLDEVRRRRGVSETALADALEACESERSPGEPERDLYLPALARYVAQLGGHLELRAVFPDETVTLSGG